MPMQKTKYDLWASTLGQKIVVQLTYKYKRWMKFIQQSMENLRHILIDKIPDVASTYFYEHREIPIRAGISLWNKK